MPMTLRTPGGWLDGGAWLFGLLALLTVLPAACVLWFMNDALSRDGQVLMPLDKYDFSRRFAWVQDRFGVSWQLNLP